MTKQRVPLSGSYRCRVESGWRRFTNVGITAGLVVGVLLVGNLIAAAESGRQGTASPSRACACSRLDDGSLPISDLRAELKLTAEQSGKLDAIRHRLDCEEAELARLIAGKRRDRGEGRVLAERLGELRAQMLKSDRKAQCDALAVLTPAQRAKLVKLPCEDARRYRQMSDQELQTTVAGLLCHSGECSVHIAGKNPPAPGYPEKMKRSPNS